MKAVLQYRASPGFRTQVAALEAEWLRIVVVDETDRAGFHREMREAEVLLHVLDPVTAKGIAGAPNLRLIQKIGVGVNTIDLGAAKARGIAVANMPGTNSQAVAEMTVLLMLGALRRVAYLDRLTRAGEGWMAELAAFDGVGELCGRTVGLVGYGEVGRRVADIVRAFGARVIYFDQERKPGAVDAWRPLAELLGEADVVSLHVPETPETAHMIDAGALAVMKRGAVLVNTARGGLVAEAALAEALRSGRLRAAGLDVHDREPVTGDSPLLDLDTVVLTPHVAWLTPETLARSLGVAVENCRRLRDGEPILNRVV